MARFILSLMELGVSATVHLLFGFYVFSTAVAADISQAAAASGCLLLRRPAAAGAGLVNVAAAGEEEEERRGAAPVVLDGSPPPIVLVHGIFGFGKGRLGGLSYFAGAEKKDDRVLVPDLGSLTSIHDRARELFYYLKGGQVDYGEQHSKLCGHARFGMTYDKGYYPVWDEQNPVHFVGHSAGVQVVRVLHQMLAEKAFPGHDTSEGWILSLTSLSGALNGTTRTYYDGMLAEDGRSMKYICLLQLCRIGVIIYDWLDIPWLKNYYNFGFDHFEMSWRKQGFSEHPNHFVVDDSDCHPLQPGIWYYKIIEADHILFIVNRERAGVQFDLLYDGIFQRCRKHAFRKSTPTVPNETSQ
ncbi:hypothetical protein GUJ93_ZPchr0010g10817 [Zizania palustris]|uniref:Lipase-like C-terminal domain-containing protein n=1 Tax=Zizania palustris TaxID=103762 RepID=A0A8J6BE73_ZIZPA|nr:hypothetical protein GUJ93_ZPchr0010g10817 [Zizania palustris]